MPTGIYKHRKFSKESKLKMRISALGRKMSKEARLKMSSTMSDGRRKKENHPRWVKDRTKLQKYSTPEKNKRSSLYREWRIEVKKRDNFKCRMLNKDCSGRLEVHHILSYTDYPKLRFIINNGITLCHFHHPRKWEEEKRLIPLLKKLVSVSKE